MGVKISASINSPVHEVAKMTRNLYERFSKHISFLGNSFQES